MKKDKLLIAAIAFGLALAGIARAEDQPISEQIVDAMNKVFGVPFRIPSKSRQGHRCRRPLHRGTRSTWAKPGRIVQRQPDPSDGAILRFDRSTKYPGRLP